MAIKKTLDIPSKGASFSVTDAYVSVTQVRVTPGYDAEGNKVWNLLALVDVHVDRDAKLAGLERIDQDELRGQFPANTNVNALSWVYTELKAKSRFNGAVDVIE